ncbi:L-lactate dehydrogenase [Microbacter margulisiae]|uniref:L-lactate dehydrogenase n=1 Tax=Microbacter margulisiae TaxID=1350067 RepID=A0A7W5DNH6_9PORP|nr:L-lactate dehydrogenase [Microbacter margulisiae]MBB3186164.1 L-lactate dehydrogenase [Microbacter margulisiae]
MTAKSVNKVAIIGAGFVGATTAYTLMLSGLIPEIVLIDINKDKSEGEVMDLNHGMPFIRPEKVYAGTYNDCKEADIVIITAGANQKQGETRLDLVNRNAKIFKDIIGNVTQFNNHCILLVVANPVDILTYLAYKLSGFPKQKVIGSGTVLDSARFRYAISEHVGIDTRNIHGYIIGEHGDSEVPTWSVTNISGVPLDEYFKANHPDSGKELPKDDIFNQVKNAAYEIIQKKGATYYGVALAVRRIVEAIVRNESSILSVSSYLDGQYGLRDLCLSVPTIVNSDGIKRIVDIPINNEELALLQNSGKALKNIIDQLDI